MTLLNEYTTQKEAANLLNVSQVTIWRWIRSGKLPAEKFGREVAIRREDIDNIKKEA